MYNARYDQLGIIVFGPRVRNKLTYLIKINEYRIFMAWTDEWTQVGDYL